MHTFAKEPNANRPAASARPGLLNSIVSGESQKADQIARLQRMIGNQALQRSLLNKADPLSTVEEALHSPGQPLDNATRLFMEPRIHQDLSRVRVHTDGKAAESAEAVGALAYTVGPDIVFGASRYDPCSPSGAGLLSHELTHVAQARGGPSPLRRKPDPNKLNVKVPDPNMVEVFKPSVDYAWQNENLRASLFPYRESAFRDFLLKEKGIDLREEARTGFPADLLSEIGEKILRERRVLDFELRLHKQQRLKAEADLRAAQKETKQHLAAPEVRDQTRQKRELEVQQKSLAAKARAQEASIAALEGKGDKMGSSEQTELEKRREMLAEIQKELANTTQSLQKVSGTLASGTAPLLSAETKLKGEIEEHKKQEKTLKPKFDRVSGGVDAKTKKADPGAAVKWQLDEYQQRINDMHHDELLGLILDRFAVDKDFTRYPKQDRYLVIHFSGMRYASANDTYGPPKELIATLKEQEIREMFEDPDRKAEMEKAAEETGAAIESELQSDKVGASRKAALRNVKKGLFDTPAAVRTGLFKKNPQFEKLEALTGERAKAMEEKDDAKAADLSQQIEQLEKQIGEPQLKKLHAALQAADLNRLKVLRDFRVKEAREQISKLNDLQALGVLQAMRDQLPEWVWDLVVRRTQLRVNFTESKKWEDPKKAPTQMDQLKRALMNPRWKKIMDHWPHEGSSWNPKFAERYEVVAETVVCNQLSEQAQHLRGNRIDQGIRGAVNWYRNRESEAKAKGVTGAAQPFFIRPTKKEDFVRGAGLFWTHFDKKEPYKENMAHRLSGIDFLTEGKHAMKDGLAEGGWTYHIDPKTEDITRTKGKDDKVETQWFSWQHEATVIKLDDLGNVITFETSGGARWNTWSLKSLLDPMSVDWLRNLHEDTNVFVGFAPEGRVLPELDKSLENILPGRNAY